MSRGKQKANTISLMFTLIFNGVPDWNRTNDLLLRRQSLYPTELRGHKKYFYLLIVNKNTKIDAKATFASSLRTILRQDPDIILLGEIRDLETAEIALQAGQTGHYVLSTIHTINAVEVITRLRKMGISDYDISSTLATAISQRLVRRICPNCRKERAFNEKEKKIINSIGEKYGIKFDVENSKTYDAVGCAKCNQSGYVGRIGVFEILNLDEPIKELIMNGASSIDIRKNALQREYRPLVVDGIKKVVAGVTTLEELNRKLRVF